MSLLGSTGVWGSSGTLNGEAMADILAVLTGSSLLHMCTHRKRMNSFEALNNNRDQRDANKTSRRFILLVSLWGVT